MKKRFLINFGRAKAENIGIIAAVYAFSRFSALISSFLSSKQQKKAFFSNFRLTNKKQDDKVQYRK